jgi:hypothetical protein
MRAWRSPQAEGFSPTALTGEGSEWERSACASRRGRRDKQKSDSPLRVMFYYSRHQQAT